MSGPVIGNLEWCLYIACSTVYECTGGVRSAERFWSNVWVE